MSKRIFTKQIGGLKIVSGATEVEDNAVTSWLAQDDIEVLGVTGYCLSTVPSENDGWAFIEVELSQTGELFKDGSIMTVCAQEGWNTTPAGVTQCNGHQAIAFPTGSAIPIKEEGHLYINMRSENKTAGMSTFRWGFTVYYTKKGYR